MRQVDHFLAGGERVPSSRKHQIWNPSTGEVQAEVVLGDAALLDKAVATAKQVQPGWAATNPQKRARVMFKFKELFEAKILLDKTREQVNQRMKVHPEGLAVGDIVLMYDHGRVKNRRHMGQPLAIRIL